MLSFYRWENWACSVIKNLPRNNWKADIQLKHWLSIQILALSPFQWIWLQSLPIGNISSSKLSRLFSVSYRQFYYLTHNESCARTIINPITISISPSLFCTHKFKKHNHDQSLPMKTQQWQLAIENYISQYFQIANLLGTWSILQFVGQSRISSKVISTAIKLRVKFTESCFRIFESKLLK